MAWDLQRDDDLTAEERDHFDLEGRGGFSWERLSSNGDENEGWGDASRSVSGRRRHREYEGD